LEILNGGTRLSSRILPWLLLSLFTAHSGFGQTVEEYELKAAFLFNFTRFIDWPAASLTNGDFIIGIFGDDPFGRLIDDITHGKSVNSHPIRIRRLKEPAEARDCHMVFVTSTDKKRNQELLDVTSRPAVLTVGETAEFLNQGGIIRLSMDNNHVSVIINNAAAAAKGLNVSAKLLTLAKIYDKGKEK
jgi:hypothetical protein